MALDTGPATLAGVKAHLGIADDNDDEALTLVVAAVNVQVRRLPVAVEVTGESWPEDVMLGATMMCGRLWARRLTPEGVAVFGTDAPAYVQRNDPDVAQLLQLGAWNRPQVG